MGLTNRMRFAASLLLVPALAACSLMPWAGEQAKYVDPPAGFCEDLPFDHFEDVLGPPQVGPYSIKELGPSKNGVHGCDVWLSKDGRVPAILFVNIAVSDDALAQRMEEIVTTLPDSAPPLNDGLPADGLAGADEAQWVMHDGSLFVFVQHGNAAVGIEVREAFVPGAVDETVAEPTVAFIADMLDQVRA